MTIGLLMHVLTASAQWNVIFVKGNQQLAIPVSMVDSIKPTVSGCFVVFIKERTITVPSEWATFSDNVSDTIVIDYHENEASVFNSRLDLFTVTADKANVSITSKSGHPFVCRATGSSSDGRLIVDADTTMTLVLDNLSLASQQASAIYLPKKQRVTSTAMERWVSAILWLSQTLWRVSRRHSTECFYTIVTAAATNKKDCSCCYYSIQVLAPILGLILPRLYFFDYQTITVPLSLRMKVRCIWLSGRRACRLLSYDGRSRA